MYLPVLRLHARALYQVIYLLDSNFVIVAFHIVSLDQCVPVYSVHCRIDVVPRAILITLKERRGRWMSICLSRDGGTWGTRGHLPPPHPPDFGRSVNPIKTRGADCAQNITNPRFSDLLAALLSICLSGLKLVKATFLKPPLHSLYNTVLKFFKPIFAKIKYGNSIHYIFLEMTCYRTGFMCIGNIFVKVNVFNL